MKTEKEEMYEKKEDKINEMFSLVYD